MDHCFPIEADSLANFLLGKAKGKLFHSIHPQALCATLSTSGYFFSAGLLKYLSVYASLPNLRGTAHQAASLNPFWGEALVGLVMLHSSLTI